MAIGWQVMSSTTKTLMFRHGLIIGRASVEAPAGKMWAEQNTGIRISIHSYLPFVS